jgi:hypothetical protein
MGSRNRFSDGGGLDRLRDGVNASLRPPAGYADPKLHSAPKLKLFFQPRNVSPVIKSGIRRKYNLHSGLLNLTASSFHSEWQTLEQHNPASLDYCVWDSTVSINDTAYPWPPIGIADVEFAEQRQADRPRC